MNDYLERLPFRLGDVLVRDSTEEAWLAGATVFEEDAPVAVLFQGACVGSRLAVYVTSVALGVRVARALEERGIFDRPRRSKRRRALPASARPISAPREPHQGRRVVLTSTAPSCWPNTAAPSSSAS